MQFSLSIAALVVSALSVSAAGHGHLHKRAHERNIAKRGTTVQANSLIKTLAQIGSADVEEGSGLKYQNLLVNNATDDAVVMFWSGEGFALPITAYNTNPAAPLLIVNLPAGSQKTVSFSNSYSGAYAAVFPETTIGSGGNIGTSWVEVTTSGQATMDVSFLPNMAARFTSVEMDGCLSDISACSYQCKNGLNSCMNADDVTVVNCPQSEFPMSNIAYGPSPWGQGGNAWNGGCQMKAGSLITTTFS